MSNFLDIRCPACGNTDQLDVQAHVWLRITADGTDADASGIGDHEYTPDSFTVCGAYGHTGELEEFEEAAPSRNPVPEVRS
jgi:hypothetical protein